MQHVAASLIALLLIATAIGKIVRPGAFLGILQATVPERFITPVRWSTVAAEIVMAATLIAAPPLGASLVLAFIVTSTITVSASLSRRDGVSCGCWGGDTGNANSDAIASVGGLVRFLMQNTVIVQVSLWISLTPVGIWSPYFALGCALSIPAILMAGICYDIRRQRRMTYAS
ncbi:MauE/DoxX family redox-associated membrane protein [Pseudonocardia nigra]|uniref:MauE/DoxX family redox-associated membrane protein n=1 Tax=Pseudonocardia nigra TaxID=1921578 RepID=UPI0035575815